jgi:hypothetical protein
MTVVKLEQESREETCNTSTGGTLGNRILDWLSPGSTTRGSVGDLSRLGAAAARCYFANPLAGCVLKAGCVSGIGDSTCVILDSGSHMLLLCRAANRIVVRSAFRVKDEHVGERLVTASFVACVMALAASNRNGLRTLMAVLGLGPLADELRSIRLWKDDAPPTAVHTPVIAGPSTFPIPPLQLNDKR